VGDMRARQAPLIDAQLIERRPPQHGRR
jgi:hypothetical protein